MIRIGVLFGGRSGEHDVSLCTAASVISAMNPDRYSVTAIGIDRDGRWYVQDEPVIIDDDDFGKIMKLEKKGSWVVNHFESDNKLNLTDLESGKSIAVDIVYPAVHGTYCEDGTLQGLLELAMVPFVGADTAGSSIGMDKDVAKRLLRDGGIPVVPWETVKRTQWDNDPEGIRARCADTLGFPLFIKPARAGSSVGVVKVDSPDRFKESVLDAFQFDTKIIIEKGIDAREVECAVLGNDEPDASILGEVTPRHDFYSYEAKYIDPDGAELIIPANVDNTLSDTIRKDAVKGYMLLNCSGMARVDFFLARESGEYYLNEINTLPGFTSISMYPKLWEHTGVGYAELIDRLIELALDKHNEKMKIKTEIGDE